MFIPVLAIVLISCPGIFPIVGHGAGVVENGKCSPTAWYCNGYILSDYQSCSQLVNGLGGGAIGPVQWACDPNQCATEGARAPTIWGTGRQAVAADSLNSLHTSNKGVVTDTLATAACAVSLVKCFEENAAVDIQSNCKSCAEGCALTGALLTLDLIIPLRNGRVIDGVFQQVPWARMWSGGCAVTNGVAAIACAYRCKAEGQDC